MRLGLVICLALAGCARAATPAPPVTAGPCITAPPAQVDPSGEWELHWTPALPPPASYNGKLSFWRSRDGDTWRVHLNFQEARLWDGGPPEKLVSELVRIDGERVEVTFRLFDGSPAELDGWIREGRFIGEMRGGLRPWSPAYGRYLGPIFR